MKKLGILNGEGFQCTILEYADGRVLFTADADIDADGANGQNGARPAYTIRNDGSEDLANGGMQIRGGRVVGKEPWFRDIVILAPDGEPQVFGGVIASKTSYRFPDKKFNDPSAYVDSETVPYMVVPPLIIQRTNGAVIGCRCQVTNTKNGRVSVGIVADIGPRNKTGEVSIAMARELGLPASPRIGGEDKPIIRYELWPGEHGSIDGNKIALLRSNGTYLHVA